MGYERRSKSSGFTLIELIVAMAMFLVLSSAAMMLVKRHVDLYPMQQGQAALNIALRNSITQIQVDLMNAGMDYYSGVDLPGAPIGVTISNQASTNCSNTATLIYSSACFDTLNIIQYDSTTPVAAPTTAIADITAINSMTITASGYTGSAIVGNYTKDSELLIVTGSVQSTGTPMYMTVTLSANATYSGNNVTITWYSGSLGSQSGSYQYNNDGITTTYNYIGYYNTKEKYNIAPQPTGSILPNSSTTNNFDTTARVLKLAPPITYSVDTTTDPNNPQLTKTVGTQTAVIADGIIGFKVGATVWGGTSVSGDDTAKFAYSTSDYYQDFSRIRALRVSLVGRTTPMNGSTFRNTFDGGPYKVEAVSTVVSPRNLSMHDQ